MQDALTAITQVAMLTFVVGGMAGLGLSLTITQVLTPLRDVRLVVTLLAANFVVVPAVAVLAARTLPMEESTGTALILLGCCAGAPFLPTLAKLAGGDQALAVGTMVLLMVATVVYAPVVVPLAVEGASVSPGDIASSLVLYMLVPLGLGLVVRARYPELAEHAAGPFNRASTAGLLIGLVSGILLTWREVLGSVGSWIFVGTLVVVVVGLAAGWLAATGRASGARTVLALAAAQRNISAALVIAVSLGGDVLVRTLVAALVVPVVLIVLAAELGKRGAAAADHDRGAVAG
jgi:bile acid:Na+ symporter, BASS family